MSKLYSKIFGLASANAVSQIVQFAIFLALARSLGPTELGKVFVGLVSSNLIFAFFDFGATTYFTRGLARGEINQVDFVAQFRIRVLFFAGINIMLSLAGVLTGNIWVLSICSVAFTQYLFQGLQALAKSKLKLSSLATGLIADRFFCLSLIVVVEITGRLSSDIALFIWAAGQLIGSAILIVGNLALKDLGYKSTFRKAMNYKRHVYLGLFSLANVLITLDQAMLGRISGTRQTGLIGAVSKWFAPMSMLSSSASLVVSNHSAQKALSVRSAIRETSKVWIAICLIATAVSIGGWFVSPLVDLLLGPQFSDAKALLGILAVSSSIVFINQPLASLLQYFDEEKYVTKLILASSGIYLVLLPLLLIQDTSHGALILAWLQVALQGSILLFLILKVINLRERKKISQG